MGVDTLEAGDCFWETLGIPKKSRFSSGNRLWQSINSEGVREMDAKRLNNRSKLFLRGLVFFFMPINPAKSDGDQPQNGSNLRQELKSL